MDEKPTPYVKVECFMRAKEALCDLQHLAVVRLLEEDKTRNANDNTRMGHVIRWKSR